jgi:hypothetical protein
MMENLRKDFTDFLLRAKRSTYAASGAERASSRPESHDLQYEEENGWLYIDTYLGSERFIGEEAVWKDGTPIWAMNYSGRVIGKGFDGDFLKEALLRVPEQSPYRGPIEYQEGSFLYCNTSAGEPDWFFGREEIFKNGVSIYECIYHGGIVS